MRLHTLAFAILVTATCYANAEPIFGGKGGKKGGGSSSYGAPSSSYGAPKPSYGGGGGKKGGFDIGALAR